MRKRLIGVFQRPVLRRLAFHLRRMTRGLDARFYRALILGLLAILLIAAAAVTLLERSVTLNSFGESFYWALTTVLGQGDASFVTSPGGWIISWLLTLFGVGIVATVTGALVAFVIDFLLKEGQGMGASGYRDHFVVCGWNATARDLIHELGSDDYGAKVVLLAPLERSPADDGVYFVRGDGVNEDDLRRAGIEHAQSAVVCPRDGSDEADMHSVLTVLAIESMAPHVRTVAEVNNPKHAAHFKRARVDEILVTSTLASRLLARSALYPGLSALVTDMVSGGEGSELYRISIPDRYASVSLDTLSAKLRRDHGATLLAVGRNGSAYLNPGPEFIMELGDDVVVVAESLIHLS